MQATVVSSFGTNQRIWQGQEFSGERKIIEPVIELAITQANAQGAYVYRFDHESAQARLCAFSGPSPAKGVGTALPVLMGPEATFHSDRRTPIVLQDGAAADERFAGLPEFQSFRFEGVVSVPLVEPAGVVGMANFCRTGRAAFRGKELAFLLGLGLPLVALLTTATLREELQKTAQLLADRKVLERAKGLLQEALGWSEENAYLHIRRLSRQQRTPMREIARQLIEAGGHSSELPA
jgi:signal transduction protein with GAF and PtsI domain